MIQFNLTVEQDNYDTAAVARLQPLLRAVNAKTQDATLRALVADALIAAFNEGIRYQVGELVAQIDETLTEARGTGEADPDSGVVMGEFTLAGDLADFLAKHTQEAAR